MGLRTYYIALHFNSNTLHEEKRGEGSLGPFAIEHLEVLFHDSNLLLLQIVVAMLRIEEKTLILT